MNLTRFGNDSRRFGFSTRSIGHMTNISSWEAEASWIVSKLDPKWVKLIYFNMNIGSNNTFSIVTGSVSLFKKNISYESRTHSQVCEVTMLTTTIFSHTSTNTASLINKDFYTK